MLMRGVKNGRSSELFDFSIHFHSTTAQSEIKKEISSVSSRRNQVQLTFSEERLGIDPDSTQIILLSTSSTQ